MFYEEDFYNEPSEFEKLVDELKSSLTNSVKEEFVLEMERLRKENAELQEIKADFENIKQVYNNKKHQLEIERRDLERVVRSERLSKLTKDFEIIMYQTSSKAEKPEKCEKCDDKRRIEYKTPLGKTAHEDCECNVGKRIYYPQEHICSEFRVNRDGNGITAFYKLKNGNSDEYYSHDSNFAEVIYNGDMKYEEINAYRTFFKTKEECQGYCDYLTEQQK